MVALGEPVLPIAARLTPLIVLFALVIAAVSVPGGIDQPAGPDGPFDRIAPRAIIGGAVP